MRRLGHVTVTAVTMVLGSTAPSVSADVATPLGGGANITVAGSNCTLTTIGHDSTGAVVGFTAGSCGGLGAPVAAAGAEPGGPLGTVAYSAGGLNTLDYAVIKFDPAKVTPIANFDGFPINGFGPDPGIGEPACMQGGATGRACGLVNVPAIGRPSTVIAEFPPGSFQPGDEGAPITVNGQLVGIFRTASDIFHPSTFRTASRGGFALFSAVLNDTNARASVGAGFSPV
jgi:hypothetical protein